MNAVLISPRLVVQKNDFLGSGIPYWPVELSILASRIRKLGFGVSFVDMFGSAPFNFTNYGKFFLQGNPIDFIGFKESLNGADVFIIFAIHYSCHKEILHVLNFLDEKFPSKVKIVLENTQAVTGYSIKEFHNQFSEAGVDFLIKNQDFLDWNVILKTKKSSKKNINNPVFLDQSVKKSNNQSEHFKRPFPAWDLVNLEAYWSLPYSHGPKQKKYLPIISSIGCPFGCDFCVIPESSSRIWLGRDPSDVVSEMIYFKKQYGVENFHFEDLNPTVKAERFEAICAQLLRKKANLSYYIVSGTKAETINLKKLPLIAASGCKYISISPETGSKKLIKEIGKPFDFVKGIELVKNAKKFNIRTQACFLVGHPSETSEDHSLTKKYLRDLVYAGLDEVAVFIVSPFAGSKLFKKGAIKTHDLGWMPSFTPNNRADIFIAKKRRFDLIKIFFIYKIISSGSIWGQGFRSIFGTPQTKMENLPKRYIFVKFKTFFKKIERS